MNATLLAESKAACLTVFPQTEMILIDLRAPYSPFHRWRLAKHGLEWENQHGSICMPCALRLRFSHGYKNMAAFHVPASPHQPNFF